MGTRRRGGVTGALVVVLGEGGQQGPLIRIVARDHEGLRARAEAAQPADRTRRVLQRDVGGGALALVEVVERVVRVGKQHHRGPAWQAHLKRHVPGRVPRRPPAPQDAFAEHVVAVLGASSSTQGTPGFTKSARQ